MLATPALMMNLTGHGKFERNKNAPTNINHVFLKKEVRKYRNNNLNFNESYNFFFSNYY